MFTAKCAYAIALASDEGIGVKYLFARSTVCRCRLGFLDDTAVPPRRAASGMSMISSSSTSNSPYQSMTYSSVFLEFFRNLLASRVNIAIRKGSRLSSEEGEGRRKWDTVTTLCAKEEQKGRSSTHSQWGDPSSSSMRTGILGPLADLEHSATHTSLVVKTPCNKQ